ncbi:hypothetical protein BDN72DRAFT_781719, partial [Pluteus cervinus]
MHKNYDIICLQEPWIDKKTFLTTASHNWRIIYPDKTGNVGEKIRSIILVNAKLNTNSWSAFRIPDTGDITAMQILDASGHKTTIFNIY